MTLNFWNTSSGALRNTVDTKSQVCAIVWSRNEEELVSSHGFSHNQLTLWKYPSMVKMAELTGHTSRVCVAIPACMLCRASLKWFSVPRLHLAQSPDGETVVSGAADETLRFWKVFGPAKRKSKASATSQGKLSELAVANGSAVPRGYPDLRSGSPAPPISPLKL